MIPFLTLGGGLELVAVKVPAEAKVVGSAIKDLLLPHESIIVLVISPDGAPRMPTPETTIAIEDEIVAITPRENEDTLRAVLTGPA